MPELPPTSIRGSTDPDEPGGTGRHDGNPTPDLDAPEPPDEDADGTVFAGRYKLIKEIGHGGMGAVWLAEQFEPVRRKVAVKLIRTGMDSREFLARFEAERQALSLMDHPNIARVFDGGTTADGRPFFVMELVKGVPITKYCDDKKLTPRQRLELFVPVCQAIQHAHQKGIIHRDIKPTNVLVAMHDDKPVPKVIDFGVAKATGQPLTEMTMNTLGFIGTPKYMSPEQATQDQLDIDTRSDVYSLGVLLYELLTGTTPVEAAGLKKAVLNEVLRMVREVESPRPSTFLSKADTLPSIAAVRGMEPARLSKEFRGELDWIAMKALEKDRTRRYETANGLARDVQRYLADEVVEARPPSVRYRMRKFVRKHRGPVMATALVLVFGATFAGYAVWQRGERKAERERVEGEMRAADLRQQVEDERRTAVEGARRTRNGDAVAELLGQCEVALQADDKEKATLALVAAEKRIPEGGTERLTNRLARCRADLVILRDLDRIDELRWTFHENKSQFEKAMVEWRGAFGRFGVMPGSTPPAQAAQRINESLLKDRLLAALDLWLAFGRSEEVLRTLIALDPDPYRTALREAIQQGDAERWRELMYRTDALSQPNRFLVVQGIFRLSLERRALLLHLAHRRQPGNFAVLMSLGEIYPINKKEGASERVGWYRAALAVRPTSTSAWNNLGVALDDNGDLNGSAEALQEARRLDPNDATIRFNLAFALGKKGEQKRAEEELREAIRLDPMLAMAHYELGILLARSRRLDEAIRHLEAAIEGDPDYAAAHYNLGVAWEVKKEWTRAIACYRDAIRINPSHTDAHINLGSVLFRQKDLDGAILHFQKAVLLDSKDAMAKRNLDRALKLKAERDAKLAPPPRAIERP